MHDAVDVARENGVDTNLRIMAVRTVGEIFCVRASNFGDSIVPSSQPLDHRAIREPPSFTSSLSRSKVCTRPECPSHVLGPEEAAQVVTVVAMAVMRSACVVTKIVVVEIVVVMKVAVVTEDEL